MEFKIDNKLMTDISYVLGDKLLLSFTVNKTLKNFTVRLSKLDENPCTYTKQFKYSFPVENIGIADVLLNDTRQGLIMAEYELDDYLKIMAEEDGKLALGFITLILLKKYN